MKLCPELKSLFGNSNEGSINSEQFTEALSNKMSGPPSSLDVNTAFKYFGHQTINEGMISNSGLKSVMVTCGSLQLSEAHLNRLLALATIDENDMLCWRQFVLQQNESKNS